MKTEKQSPSPGNGDLQPVQGGQPGASAGGQIEALNDAGAWVVLLAKWVQAVESLLRATHARHIKRGEFMGGMEWRFCKHPDCVSDRLATESARFATPGGMLRL